jgi:hypothetical protein
VARANNARGSVVYGSDAARPEQARVRQQKKEEEICGRRRATHSGISARRAQAAAELVCRKVARGTEEAAVRRLQADPHGNSSVASGECRRPLRRKQRVKSGGTMNCSWWIWRWPSASRPRSSRRRRREYSVTSRKEKRRSEGGGYSTASSEGAAAQRQGGQGRSNTARI